MRSIMCISADAFAEKSGFLCIYIPAKDIGRAVGAGGTNIRALQRYTATKIAIEQSSDSDTASVSISTTFPNPHAPVSLQLRERTAELLSVMSATGLSLRRVVERETEAAAQKAAVPEYECMGRAPCGSDSQDTLGFGALDRSGKGCSRSGASAARKARRGNRKRRRSEENAEEDCGARQRPREYAEEDLNDADMEACEGVLQAISSWAARSQARRSSIIAEPAREKNALVREPWCLELERRAAAARLWRIRGKAWQGRNAGRWLRSRQASVLEHGDKPEASGGPSAHTIISIHHHCNEYDRVRRGEHGEDDSCDQTPTDPYPCRSMDVSGMDSCQLIKI